MSRFALSLLFTCLALSSCAKLGLLGKSKPEKKDQPYGPTGIPPQLRAKAAAPPGATPVIAPSGVNQPGAIPITPESDIVYIDPDNPESSLAQLSTLLEAPKRGPWEQSETIAKRRAAREGKPILIWFTNSANSAMCKALSQELLATSEFGAWATDHLVRLKIDMNLEASLNDPDITLDQKEAKRIDVANYNTDIKKRYKVQGHPTLVMLNSSGEVVGKYTGYSRGESKELWGRMKHAQAVSVSAYKNWKANLESKGYREWSDRKGRKVLAKLIHYAKDGTLTLTEPDGTKSQTPETNLSDQDRSWIAEQKKLRGLQ